MIAVIINTLAIVIGSLIGLVFRKGIPEKLSTIAMQALGLCTIVIGIQGAIKEPNILILIISITVGGLIGEGMDWDGHVNRFTEKILKNYAQAGEASKIANAFVTSCLIMNVGAMVIVGSLDAGLRANYDLLYTKSLLDFISAIMMTAAMGIGVMGSAGFTLIFQGAIVLLAQYIAPFISEAVITEISCTGCLLILAIGLNMINLTKIKVLNYLPALIVAPIVLAITKNFGF